mmetsp:Transcript_2195/g.8668  ORF Transcript_2195/g.8668 Transcript_2195/m.8668 type:complete len:392 (+) Transcript_2195:856-2031(+)
MFPTGRGNTSPTPRLTRTESASDFTSAGAPPARPASPSGDGTRVPAFKKACAYAPTSRSFLQVGSSCAETNSDPMMSPPSASLLSTPAALAASASFGGRRSSEGPTPCVSNPRRDPTPPRKKRSATHVPFFLAASPSGTSAPSLALAANVTPSTGERATCASTSCLKKRVICGSAPIPASSLRRRYSAPRVGRVGESRVSATYEYATELFSECPSWWRMCLLASRVGSAISRNTSWYSSVAGPPPTAVTDTPRAVSSKLLSRFEQLTCWYARVVTSTSALKTLGCAHAKPYVLLLSCPCNTSTSSFSANPNALFRPALNSALPSPLCETYAPPLMLSLFFSETSTVTEALSGADAGPASHRMSTLSKMSYEFKMAFASRQRTRSSSREDAR